MEEEKTKVQQVKLKDPEKVEAAKRLAEWNRKNKGKLVQAAKVQESKPKLSQSLWQMRLPLK